MKRPTQRRATVALAALALVAGCSAPTEGTANVYEGTEEVEEAGELIGNPSLAKHLSILNPRSKRREGRLVVEFDLQNKRSGTLEFAWTVDWYDREGFLVQNATRHWQPVALGGGAQTTVSILAPSPEAQSWKLQVTSPNQVD